MPRSPPLQIKDVMTRSTVTVESSDALVIAKEKLMMHGIRNLPVLDAGRVVGILSLGDLYAMESVMSFDPDETTVSSAMCSEPYVVEGEKAVAEVASEMAKRRIGSVVVTRGGEITGIFTATDACRLLGDVLGRGSPG